MMMTVDTLPLPRLPLHTCITLLTRFLRAIKISEKPIICRLDQCIDIVWCNGFCLLGREKSHTQQIKSVFNRVTRQRSTSGNAMLNLNISSRILTSVKLGKELKHYPPGNCFVCSESFLEQKTSRAFSIFIYLRQPNRHLCSDLYTPIRDTIRTLVGKVLTRDLACVRKCQWMNKTLKYGKETNSKS